MTDYALPPWMTRALDGDAVRTIDAATHRPGTATADPSLPYAARVLRDAVAEAYPGATVAAHDAPTGATVTLTLTTPHGTVTARAEGRTLGDACRALAPWTVPHA